MYIQLLTNDSSVGRAGDCRLDTKSDISRSLVQIRLGGLILDWAQVEMENAIIQADNFYTTNFPDIGRDCILQFDHWRLGNFSFTCEPKYSDQGSSHATPISIYWTLYKIGRVLSLHFQYCLCSHYHYSVLP